jgi:hypothetical protein
MKNCVHIGLRYKRFTAWASARSCTRRTQNWEQIYLNNSNCRQTIPLAARSKPSVCGRSPARNECSNPAGKHGCLSLVSVVCAFATVRSLVRRSPTRKVCLSVIKEPHTGGPGPLGLPSNENNIAGNHFIVMHSQRMIRSELQTLSSQYLFVRFKKTKN